MLGAAFANPPLGQQPSLHTSAQTPATPGLSVVAGCVPGAAHPPLGSRHLHLSVFLKWSLNHFTPQHNHPQLPASRSLQVMCQAPLTRLWVRGTRIRVCSLNGPSIITHLSTKKIKPATPVLSVVAGYVPSAAHPPLGSRHSHLCVFLIVPQPFSSSSTN
jgi:hypothetical protein